MLIKIAKEIQLVADPKKRSYPYIRIHSKITISIRWIRLL